MTRLTEGDVNSPVTTVIENKTEMRNEIDLVKNLKKEEIKFMQKIILGITFLFTVSLFSIILSKNQSIKGHKIMFKRSTKKFLKIGL